MTSYLGLGLENIDICTILDRIFGVHINFHPWTCTVRSTKYRTPHLVDSGNVQEKNVIYMEIMKYRKTASINQSKYEM